MKKIIIGMVSLLCALSCHSAFAGGAVVVAKDSPIATMDTDQAKKVFLGRETSLAGLNVTVIYQKDGATRSGFEEKILGKTGGDLTSYWSKLIFTGKAQAPTEVASDGEVKSKVNATPGAVGYISDSAVDGSVKVLLKY